jgi:hypothetical protein
MRKLYPLFLFGALGVAAACASTVANDFPSGTDDGGIVGASDSNVFGLPPDDGSSNFRTLPDGNADAANDSGVSLGADGAVVGTCVVGRTCDPTCDELQENGTHEYIEPNPDDGSPLPPSNAATLFSGTASTTGGPCIIDPPDGSIFPNNWLRPRIFFNPANTAQTIFQIRVHADRQMTDLVVYTESRSWELPKDIWTKLAASTWSEDITVTVSAVAPGGGTPTSSQVKFQIAPANANGSMVYWAAVGDQNGLSWLEAFGVGDEGVSQVLTVPQVQSRYSRDQGGNPTTENGSTVKGAPACIGCHTVAPDQQSVAFLDFYPWPGVTARIDGTNAGAVPTWLTPAGAEAFSQPWLGMLSFSDAAWAAGAQRVVSTYAIAAGQLPWANGTSYSGPPDTSAIAPRLAWFDLASTAAASLVQTATASPAQETALAANAGTTFGIIATTGDTRGAESPAWSHDSSTIVYASTNMGKDGRLAGQVGTPETGMSDLYTVPYNGGAGGTATPLQGAAETAWDEFYPSFSPDDAFVAFDRVPNADGIRYYAPKAEVYVVPSAGGTATRLMANDPPACMKQINTNMAAVSPGVTNSWPRWSPEYPTCDGKTYYWLIFSSSRLGIPFGNGSTTKSNLATIFKHGMPTYTNEPTSQLYLTALVTTGGGAPQTFPAIDIWNQPINSTTYPDAGAGGSAQSNHTPSWEVVEIPPPMTVPPPPPPPPPR